MSNLTQKELDSYLIEHAQDGDVDGVNMALDKGANVDAYNGIPIRRAAAWDKIKVVGLLLKRGSNVNGNTDISYHTLNSAVRNNNLRMVRLLIEHGAKVHPDHAETAIDYTDNINPNIIKLLIKHGGLQLIEERLFQTKYKFEANPGISNFINGFVWAIQDKRFREANGYYNAAKKSLKSYTVEKMINDSAKHMVSFEDLDNDMIKYLLSKGANPDIFATKLMRKYDFKQNPNGFINEYISKFREASGNNDIKTMRLCLEKLRQAGFSTKTLANDALLEILEDYDDYEIDGLDITKNWFVKLLLQYGADPSLVESWIINQEYRFAENPRPSYTFNYDNDTFVLSLTISKKKYSYYNISPFKFNKFRAMLRKNFGKAMAYLKKTQG